MAGEDLVEQLGRVVEREPGVLHKPLLFLLEKPCEAVVFLIVRIASGLDAVQQVVVEIARAGLPELLVENLVAVLQRVEEGAVQFCSEREAVAGMAVDERLLGHTLAGEAVVHPRCVEIGEALFEEQVDHLLHLLHVHAGGAVGVELGQTHESEAEFFHDGCFLPAARRECLLRAEAFIISHSSYNKNGRVSIVFSALIRAFFRCIRRGDIV